MIPPSRLPRVPRVLRRRSTTPPPETDGAGIVKEIQDMVSEALSSFDEESATAHLEAGLGMMELQYPQAELFDHRDQNPVYIFTETGWREPTAAEALALTIPFQDPEVPEPNQLGMGIRDCDGQSSPYVRQENDDIGVAPSEVMTGIPRSFDANSSDDYDSDDELLVPASTQRRVKVKVPKIPKLRERRKSTSKRAKSPLPPPSPETVVLTDTNTRKRKATESPAASKPPSTSRARSHKSIDNVSVSSDNKQDNLDSIAESDDETDDDDNDDLLTLVGSSPEKDKSPPRKVRPPHSGGSSPLKPKSAFTFMGYHCQMPGCAFSASSPQHIRHHYETFQHGRVTRQLTMMQGR